MPKPLIVDYSQRIDAGNGLVPSGKKPLTELMLTKFFDTKWRHRATVG